MPILRIDNFMDLYLRKSLNQLKFLKNRKPTRLQKTNIDEIHLDISKAFDKVTHKHLLNCFSYNGLNWLN